MSHDAFISIEKLTTSGIILVAAKHNKRQERGDGAKYDPSLSHLNHVLHGPASAKEVDELAKKLMLEAGITKQRKNGVRCIEFLFSLPKKTRISPVDYFQACTDWTGSRFGGMQNILSSDIHLDESSPHCHVLLLPLLNGKLNGSDMKGNKLVLDAHLNSFYSDVASKYGLHRPPGLLRGNEKQLGAKLVIEELEARADTVILSCLWGLIKKSIIKCPDPYLLELGMLRPSIEAPRKTFEQIALSTGKGAKTEQAEAYRDSKLGRTSNTQHQPNESPLGNQEQVPGEAARTHSLSCVGNFQQSTSFPASTALPESSESNVQDTEFTRDRHSDQHSEDWDCTIGDFVTRSPPQRMGKAEAEAITASLLHGIRLNNLEAA